MSVLSQVVGLAGVRAAKTVLHRMVTRGGWIPDILPQGRVISGACSRDPTNTPDVSRLQAGVLMGKISSVVNSLGTVNYYAPSVLGPTTVALTATGTTVTAAAATITELVRRCGTTGTFNMTGGPTANATARTLLATYSATTATTATITALGVNEVQTLNFANSPAGTFTLTIVDLNGLPTTTPPITYSGTAATLVSNINTAVTTAIGGSLVVASGSAVTAIAMTFSGTGYAALPQPFIVVGTNELTAGTVAITRTTAGVDGRMVSGSLIQPTDGSQSPLTFIPNGWPLQTLDFDGVTNLDVEFGEIPVGCIIDSAQLINWPTDTGIQAYIRTSLSTVSAGKFIFNDQY